MPPNRAASPKRPPAAPAPAPTPAPEEEVTVVKEKANAVEFEIGMNDRRTKLKPLPPQLLSRMMHGTNANQFEFMKNPNAKLGGSLSSAGSQSFASRSSRTISPQSALSFGDTIMDRMEESLKEIRRSAAAEAEKEAPPPAAERKRKERPPRPKSDPEPVLEKEPEPAQVSETDKLPVAAELDILDEKETAVCFDITFSPKAGKKAAKGPSAALVERLQQRPSTATKSQPRAASPRAAAPKRSLPSAEEEAEREEAEAAAECQSPTRFPPSTVRRGRAGQRRVFGEPSSTPLSGAAGIVEGQGFLSPTCASPSRGTSQAIGVGIGIEDQPERALPEPEALDDDTRQQCEAWVRLLGLHPVKCLYSRHWQHRREGVQKVGQMIAKYRQAKPEFKDKLFKVFGAIVQLRLADTVMQVYQETLDMARALLEFGRDVPQESVDEAVEQMVPVILRRAGDGNQRICSTAEEFLYWLAACEDARGFNHIAHHITKPIPDAAKAYKHVVARLKVIAHLVTAHGLQPNKEDGFSAEAVNRFTLDVVETVNRRVCQDAAEVVKLLYKKLGLKAIHLLNIQVKDNASEEYLQRALGPLIGELIMELHQPERKAKMQASDSLLALAMHDKVGAAFIAKYAQQPPEDLFDSAALTGRLELLTRMVSALGFSATGLTAQKVMLFALPGIQSEFEGVRKAAADLVVACHKVAGDEVWQFLVVADGDAVAELKRRVMSQAKAACRGGGGGSVKARLAADVSIARAQDRTIAFAERR